MLGGWQVMRAYDALLAEAEQAARNLTRSLAQHAARTLEGGDLLLSGAAERVEGNVDRDHLDDYLGRRLAHVPQMADLALADAHGRWIADAAPTHVPIGTAYGESFAWHRDHAGPDLHVGTLVPDVFSGRPVIPLSRRIDNADGTFAGVVAGSILPDYLGSFYDTVHIGSHGTVTLWTRDGEVLVRHPALKQGLPPGSNVSVEAARLFAAPSGMARSVSPFDGVERIFTFERVEGYPLVVSAGIAVDDALAGWRQEATIEGLVVVAATIGLVGLGVGLGRHRRRVDAVEAASGEIDRRYRLLAENSSDLVTLEPSFLSARSYVSPSSHAIVGWSPDELAMLPVAEYVHPEDAGRVAAEYAALTPDNPRVASLHRVRHKAGHYVWLEAVFQLTDAGEVGQSVIVAARDVTARQEVQQALADSEARYRLLADASSDMVSRLGLDGRRLYVSPSVAEILGFDAAELVGTVPFGFVHSDDLVRVQGVFAGLAEGRTDRARSVHRVRHKDGHWVWAEVLFRLVRDVATGEPLEVISSVRDVTERETLQQRLQGTNRLLTMAEEVAHVGHWRVELPDNRLMWSAEVYRILGQDPAEFELNIENAIALYHPDDRAEVARCVGEAVEARKGYEFRLRAIRPDGEVRHVLSRGVCELDEATGAVRAVFGAFMDVTDLVEAERRVSEKSALLETTLDNMDQALVKIAADGTIELANRRFTELLDLPATLLERARPNFEDVLEHLLRSGEYGRSDATFRSHVAARGAPLTLGTYERIRPNGTILEVRTVPASDGAVVRTYADITARRQAERALRESEAQYRVLADSTSDVIMRLGLDLKRHYVSPACRLVLGYEPQEMLDDPSCGYMHPEEAEEGRALATLLAAGGIAGDRAVKTYRARHKEGRWIWVEAGMSLVRDAGSGAPLCVTCTIRDVTERQRSARHLERARAAAEQAATAKAEFLANMSHELRTPLTGILGVHDLLRADASLGANQRRLIGLAAESGRALLGIVNDILDFSKLEAGQLSVEHVPFDVAPLVEGCRDLAAKGLGGKPVRIDMSMALSGHGQLLGDPARLRQVLLNLLTNSVKFTERGRIGVDVSYHAEVRLLRVEVTDTGIGIAADKLGVLFERFSQADASTTRRYGGTGLGLAISKRLVELMDGRIGVRSEPGRGSCFWFELPTTSHSVPTSSLPASSEPERGTRRRILLAEDNKINQEIILAMLANRGHTITAVDDGAAAIEAVGSLPVFDIVLMDVQMPYMDGLTATRAIRALEHSRGGPRVPILGLTANAMAEDVERCLVSGMDEHVAKPIDWAKLFSAINRLTDERCPSSAEAPPPVGGEELEVLDLATLDALSRIIGRERLSGLLTAFAADLEHRAAGLYQAAGEELSAQTHRLRSAAAQLGFRQLAQLCSELEEGVLRGSPPQSSDALRVTVRRALAAVKTSPFAIAA